MPLPRRSLLRLVEAASADLPEFLSSGFLVWGLEFLPSPASQPTGFRFEGFWNLGLGVSVGLT